MVYRTYLRAHDGRVSEKTVTPDQRAAGEAFAALVDRTDLDGQKMAAALTCNNRQLAFHRFDREPGRSDYWRGRLDEIEWPAVAGQIGRPPEMAGGRRVNVYLDASSLRRAAEIGDGNVSEGIRRALKAR